MRQEIKNRGAANSGRSTPSKLDALLKLNQKHLPWKDPIEGTTEGQRGTLLQLYLTESIYKMLASMGSETRGQKVNDLLKSLDYNL
jgi:hypothetical protein